MFYDKMESEIIVCIMLKNEEDIILRCLDSCFDHKNIIGYCMTDTGSTDGTKGKVINYLREHKKYYSYTDVEWVNFGHNRSLLFTEAMRFAKEMKNENAYALMLDADMILSCNDKFLGLLSLDAYYVDHHLGSLVYKKPALMRLNKEWKSIGIVHEYWDAPEEITIGVFPHIRIIEYTDGSNRKNKFERDAKLLEDKFPTDDVRTIFYLAQTYKDLGRYEEAIEKYKLHIEKGSWSEETWYSEFMIGYCMDRMKYKDAELDIEYEQIKEQYLKSYVLRPQRAEPLYYLVVMLIRLGKTKEAFIYINTAKDILYPITDLLFIERDIYTKYIPLLYSTLLGKFIENTQCSCTSFNSEAENKKRKKLQRDLVDTSHSLLLRTDVNETDKPDLLCNLEKFSPDIFDAYNVKVINIPNDEDVIHTDILNVVNGATVLLVQRSEIIIYYALHIDTLSLQPINAENISYTVCNLPKLFEVNGKSGKMFFNSNDVENVERKFIVEYEEKTFKFNQEYTIYTNKEGKSIMINLDGIGLFPGACMKEITSEVCIDFFEIIGKPIVTDEGNIFLCSYTKKNVYVFVLEKDGKVVSVSFPFKLDEIGTITSFTPTCDLQAVLLSKLKFISIDVRYILSLFSINVC